MRALIAYLTGATTAVVAILLHQTLPPFGVAIAIIFSYFAIWIVGRKIGARRYKFYAAVAWIVVILRASTFGAGQELLVQADGVGSALLLIGTVATFSAIAARS